MVLMTVNLIDMWLLHMLVVAWGIPVLPLTVCFLISLASTVPYGRAVVTDGDQFPELTGSSELLGAATVAHRMLTLREAMLEDVRPVICRRANEEGLWVAVGCSHFWG